MLHWTQIIWRHFPSTGIFSFLRERNNFSRETAWLTSLEQRFRFIAPQLMKPKVEITWNGFRFFKMCCQLGPGRTAPLLRGSPNTPRFRVPSPPSGHNQKWTNKCINMWNDKSMFPLLSFSLSVSVNQFLKTDLLPASENWESWYKNTEIEGLLKNLKTPGSGVGVLAFTNNPMGLSGTALSEGPGLQSSPAWSGLLS